MEIKMNMNEFRNTYKEMVQDKPGPGAGKVSADEVKQVNSKTSIDDIKKAIAEGKTVYVKVPGTKNSYYKVSVENGEIKLSGGGKLDGTSTGNEYSYDARTGRVNVKKGVDPETGEKNKVLNYDDVYKALPENKKKEVDQLVKDHPGSKPSDFYDMKGTGDGWTVGVVHKSDEQLKLKGVYTLGDEEIKTVSNLKGKFTLGIDDQGNYQVEANFTDPSGNSYKVIAKEGSNGEFNLTLEKNGQKVILHDGATAEESKIYDVAQEFMEAVKSNLPSKHTSAGRVIDRFLATGANEYKRGENTVAFKKAYESDEVKKEYPAQ